MPDKQRIAVEEPKKKGAVRGNLTLEQGVVEIIAGLAARSVPGINRLGKSRLIPINIGDDPKRGVVAEVGQKQAALDIDVVIEHGIDIRDVAGQLRKKIAAEVGKMAGREVVEVNLHVVGIHLPEPQEPAPRPPASRVL